MITFKKDEIEATVKKFVKEAKQYDSSSAIEFAYAYLSGRFPRMTIGKAYALVETVYRIYYYADTEEKIRADLGITEEAYKSVYDAISALK